MTYLEQFMEEEAYTKKESLEIIDELKICPNGINEREDWEASRCLRKDWCHQCWEQELPKEKPFSVKISTTIIVNSTNSKEAEEKALDEFYEKMGECEYSVVDVEESRW